MIFSSKVSKNYAWEFILFRNYRSLSDGISLIEFTCNLDWYDGDHCPKFDLSFRLFNWTIFEFNVYNVNHYEDDEE
jgi:hypothetical protein